MSQRGRPTIYAGLTLEEKKIIKNKKNIEGHKKWYREKQLQKNTVKVISDKDLLLAIFCQLDIPYDYYPHKDIEIEIEL